MIDANDRELTRAQRAILLAEYIKEHKSISFAEARKVCGYNRYRTWRLLLEIDGVIATYREGNRRVLLEE